MLIAMPKFSNDPSLVPRNNPVASGVSGVMQLPNLVFSGSKKETRTNTILENFFFCPSFLCIEKEHRSSKEMELQQQLPLRKKMKDTSNNVPEATFHYQIADDERSCCKHVLFLEQKM